MSAPAKFSAKRVVPSEPRSPRPANWIRPDRIAVSPVKMLDRPSQ